MRYLPSIFYNYIPFVTYSALIGSVIGFGKLKYLGRICRSLVRFIYLSFFALFIYINTFVISLLFIWKPFNVPLRRKIMVSLLGLLVIICFGYITYNNISLNA